MNFLNFCQFFIKILFLNLSKIMEKMLKKISMSSKISQIFLWIFKFFLVKKIQFQTLLIRKIPTPIFYSTAWPTANTFIKITIHSIHSSIPYIEFCNRVALYSLVYLLYIAEACSCLSNIIIIIVVALNCIFFCADATAVE